MTHIKVNVPGHIVRTKHGHVRQQTLKMLVRKARQIEPAMENFAAVEVVYASAQNPYARDYSTVTFNTNLDKQRGF